jgi:endonuclease IV
MLLGIHVSKNCKISKDKSKTLSAAIKRDVEKYGINCVQIFTHGPQNFKENNLDYEEIKEYCKDINIYSHSAYLSVFIWNIKSNEHNKLSLIKMQLSSIKKCGGSQVVLHISKKSPETVADIMNLLKPIIKQTKTKLLLEMVASKSDKNLTYETPEKINNLIEKISQITGDNPNKSNWYGFCIDTAHIYASGVDISTNEKMQYWFDNLKYPKMINMIHLNGSYSNMGSGKDKHCIAMIKDDKIWGNLEPKKSGVNAVVKFSRGQNIPMICEINKGTVDLAIYSLDLIKDL